jgi:RNA polymerase sigma-70 factor (ECF subfamily)
MDQAAFRAFYQNTAPRLRTYIAQSCGSAEAADDILQEVFVRFLRVAQKGDEKGMRAYLYRTANSIIIDNWRRHKREMAWSLKMPFPGGASMPWEIDDDVKSAFAELNAQQRSLLWLAYVEGYDHREIAAAVGVREKSVRVLLFRARRALAGLLERAGIGPEVA